MQKDVFPQIWEALKSSPAWIALLAAGVYPYFSLDNANVHKAAMSDEYVKEMAKKGMRLEPIYVPAYSPDLHKVIEHSHANTTRAFKSELRKCLLKGGGLRELKEIPDFWAVLQVCFKEQNQPTSIDLDVQSLNGTYSKVLKLGGGYPAKKFR